ANTWKSCWAFGSTCPSTTARASIAASSAAASFGRARRSSRSIDPMTARLIMKLKVAQARYTTPDVLRLTFVHPRRPELPAWTPGAHVDLRLPDGRARQYSLCGDPADRTRYDIAIKREAAGRGASMWAH